MAARRKSRSNPPPALLEWAMGILGGLVVLAVLAVITLEALQPQDPAHVVARLESVRPAGQTWLAQVEVRNLGRETAAAVEVEGRLGPEAARATLDYVPARGRERVVLVFGSDPRSGLDVSVKGWSEP